ncbi:hypothetical protein AAFF_G00172820 [Aldrovandia affinis]|uniref:Uncharacterized protein n=1 Tax=Aldrovandia affinis TaxID=143900 RepID=A0AAD7T0V4_9TELE|nr:hypothetical protein AAFF_G00172820 [Aldrovandia affinis]
MLFCRLFRLPWCIVGKGAVRKRRVVGPRCTCFRILSIIFVMLAGALIASLALSSYAVYLMAQRLQPGSSERKTKAAAFSLHGGQSPRT